MTGSVLLENGSVKGLTGGIRCGLMLSQCSQAAAGGTQGRAGRTRGEPGADRVVLEAVGLAARAEICVRRRLHRRHARVVGVQVRVIHFVHVESGEMRLGSWSGPCTCPGG